VAYVVEQPGAGRGHRHAAPAPRRGRVRPTPGSGGLLRRRRTKSSTGQYILNDPSLSAVSSLWGVRVIVTTAPISGTGLLIDTQKACKVYVLRRADRYRPREFGLHESDGSPDEKEGRPKYEPPGYQACMMRGEMWPRRQETIRRLTQAHRAVPSWWALLRVGA
jgi:hypothetical protein